MEGRDPIARLLLSPGPTNTAAEIRDAMAYGDFSHRDPEVAEAFQRVRSGILRAVGGTGTHDCVLFASSGTGAMEAILSTLHGRLLVVVNGRYSERLCQIAARYAIPTVRHPVDPFTPIDPEAVADALDADPGITHVVVVQHETTTGMLAPLRMIGAVVAQRGRLLVVDGVGGVGGHEFDLVADNVAFCALNPNKCLESLPGLGIVLASTAELRAAEGRARTFYFDLHAQWRRGQHGEFPYTMPVQILIALDRAVGRWLAEGVQPRIDRYAAAAAHLRAGLTRAGFTVVDLPPGSSGNIITTVELPAGLAFPTLVARLRERGYTLYSNLETVHAGRFFVATMGVVDHGQLDDFVGELVNTSRELLDRAAPGSG
jgi:2-aminoethylphosphonate-pyruvate transaminase